MTLGHPTAMSTRTPLPSYNTPPVSEVAIGVQFDALEDVKAAHLGILWGEFRADFPGLEEHPPRDPSFERFEIETTQRTPSVQVIGALPVPRFWYLSEDGSELIQVQQDRFVFNWRKLEGTGSYPRYRHVRAEFVKRFAMFRAFLDRSGLGTPVPNQCELLYENLITPGPVWSSHGEIGNVIPTLRPRYSDEFLGQPEDIQATMRFRMADGEEPVGRLYIQVIPAFMRQDATPAIKLRLTARGAPREPTEASALAFLDTAHKWIVRGFTSITSPRMHEVWGREDD